MLQPSMPLPEGVGLGELFESLMLKASYPDHEEFRNLLYLQGGGGRLAYTAGVCQGLQESEHDQGYDVIVAESAGAILAAGLASGQAALFAEGFCEIAGHRSFIRFNRWGEIVGTKRLGPALRGATYGGRFRLDVDAVRSARVRVIVMVATRDGRVDYLDLKKVPDIVSALMASVALPGCLSGRTVRIYGEDYGDAAMIEQFPYGWMREEIRPTPTCISFVPNQPLPLPLDLYTPLSPEEEKQIQRARLFESVIRTCALLGYPKSYKKLARRAPTRLREQLEEAIYANEGPHFSIFPTPTDVTLTPFTTDRKKLRAAVEDGRTAVHRELERYQESLRRLAPLDKPDSETFFRRWQEGRRARLLRSLAHRFPTDEGGLEAFLINLFRDDDSSEGPLA